MYDPSFDFTNPELQEYLYQTCLTISIRKDIVQGSGEACVLSDFKTWLLQTHQLTFPFPKDFVPKEIVNKKGEPTGKYRTMNYLLYDFITNGVIGRRHQSYVLFDSIPTGENRLSKSKVLRIIFMFYSNERSYEGGFQAMSSYAIWESMLTLINQ